MTQIFIVWDFKTRALRPTLESLQDDPPDRMQIEIPGLETASGEIHSDLVIDGIQRADRVLAVLSCPNVNVGFEIGVAYGLGKEIALAVYGKDLPSWVRRPPLANFLAQPFDGVDDLVRMLPDKVWHRRREEKIAAASDQDPTLFLCPRTGTGQSYLRKREKMGHPWRMLPEHSFSLIDLPHLTAGVRQLVWTVAAFAEGAEERDGEENAANAVVAGWFFAQQLRATGQRKLSGEERAALRERFWVLRASEARPVADAEPFAREFDGLRRYEQLLREVPTILPAVATVPSTANDPDTGELQTFLLANLALGEFIELGRKIGGEPLARALANIGEKGARAAHLAASVGGPSTPDPFVLQCLAEFMPGSETVLGLGARSSPRAATASPAQEQAPTMGGMLGAAQRLDRTVQWGQLVDEVQEDRHGLLLLRGDSRQGLGLFLQRLSHSRLLSDYRVVPVGFSHEGVRARSGGDWEQRLAAALAPQVGQKGRAADHLARAAQDARLFLLLGRHPLFELTDAQRSGLREFLSKTYPQCLADAAPRRPVRLLVPLETEADDGWVVEVEAWASAGEAHFRKLARQQTVGGRLIHYVRLRPVEFPTRQEVEEYIGNHMRPLPSEPVRARILSEYERIAAHPDLTFRNLTDLLDKHLELD